MPRFAHHGRSFRLAQLVRHLQPLNGHPRVRIALKPRGEWGSAEPALTRGSNHLRYVLPVTMLRVNISAPPTYVAEGNWLSLDSPVSLLIGPDETLAPLDATPRAAAFWL